MSLASVHPENLITCSDRATVLLTTHNVHVLAAISALLADSYGAHQVHSSIGRYHHKPLHFELISRCVTSHVPSTTLLGTKRLVYAWAKAIQDPCGCGDEKPPEQVSSDCRYTGPNKPVGGKSLLSWARNQARKGSSCVQPERSASGQAMRMPTLRE